MIDSPARRALIVTRQAKIDLSRRGALLTQERGADFAANWLRTLYRWLDTLTDGTVTLGTSHAFSEHARSFPYKKQATILVEYTPTEMRIVRIYFAGQDWLG